MLKKVLSFIFFVATLPVNSFPIGFTNGSPFAMGLTPVCVGEMTQNISFRPLNAKQEMVVVNTPPTITATVFPTFCTGIPSPLLSHFSISDPDDVGVSEIHIKVSEGYVRDEDLLTFQSINPNLTADWRSDIGKLTIRSLTGLISYTDLETAMLSVLYSNSNSFANGGRVFSIYLGDAEYNYANDHFYLYKAQQNITWTDAFVASSAETLFGMASYFVTITSAEEMLFIGNQVTRTGWIGASDTDNEGTWEWVAGPEAGETFWVGGINGTAVGYANWDSIEPSNSGGIEDYAQIIPNHPMLFWNDNRNIGDAAGAYITPGYTIEFGGLPDDLPLTFVANVSITLLPQPSVADQESCGPRSFTFTSSMAQTYWFADQTSTVPLYEGQVFTTPLLSSTTTYYISQYLNLCLGNRVAVTAVIAPVPTVTIPTLAPICLGEAIVVRPVTTGDTVKWFTDDTSTTPFATGDLTLTQPEVSDVVYVEAQLGACSSERVAVDYTVLFVPASAAYDVSICKNVPITLQASSGVAYQWNTGLTSSSIVINEAGTYTVAITVANGCSFTEQFTATYPPLPTVPQFTFENGGVGIALENAEAFEFSLNGIDYQSTPFFSLVNGGRYLLYVRDISLCTVTTFPFLWLKPLPFFTPNGDGINDVWTIEGISSIGNFKLYVFDRYGKLVALLSNDNPSWDGTFKGIDLPSSDYWYRAEVDNFLAVATGHFSLKR